MDIIVLLLSFLIIVTIISLFVCVTKLRTSSRLSEYVCSKYEVFLLDDNIDRYFRVFDDTVLDKINLAYCYNDWNEDEHGKFRDVDKTLVENYNVLEFRIGVPDVITRGNVIIFPDNGYTWKTETYLMGVDSGKVIYPESNSILVLGEDFRVINGSKMRMIIAKK